MLMIPYPVPLDDLTQSFMLMLNRSGRSAKPFEILKIKNLAPLLTLNSKEGREMKEENQCNSVLPTPDPLIKDTMNIKVC